MCKSVIIKFLSVFFLLVPFTGCVPDKVMDPVNKALQLVEEGIQTINYQSDQWRATLEYIHSEFPEDLHWAKEDISQLISEGIGAASSNILCVIDAIPNRIIRGLQNLKAKLLNQSTVLIAPTVCNTTISTIDMNAPAHNRTEIIVNGYDFVNGYLLKLVLRSADGAETTVTESRLFKQSDYQYTINIANWDNILEEYTALVFKFDEEVLSEFGIIPPDHPRITTFEFLPDPSGKLCPTRVGNGDREFAGNGPNFTCRASLFVVNGQEIWVELFFHVKETRSDWTEARYLESRYLKDIPKGYKFNRFLTGAENIWTGEDRDHAVNIKSFDFSHLVKEFHFNGDTGGTDVGNCTDDDAYMKVFFHAVKIEIIEE